MFGHVTCAKLGLVMAFFLFFYNMNNRCARKLKTKTEKTILFLAHVIYGFMVSFIMMIQYRVCQKKLLDSGGP